MLIDLYIFAVLVLIGTGTLICTVWSMNHWLVKADKHPPKHYRTAPTKEKLVAPVAVRKCTVRPEEAETDEG